MIGVLVMLRGLLRELIGWFTRLPALRRMLALSADGRQRLKFWLRSIVDVLLAMAGAVLVLSLWGLSLQDQLSWIGQAMRGVRIGQVTLSPIDLLLALGFFVLVLVLTRLGQRLLSERVLPKTRIDSGVQNSLTSGLGYIGGGIAIMAAISAVGIDLSSIALIAGALSVGIGFGLQNIVNNFVSGLILLVERPVKVGDWVVVGEHEGFVRRISVRATELQTFQYAAVIIPNADILSSALTNWTFKDRYGRIEVAVRTVYGTDFDRVQAILLEVARGHPRVVRFPEAFALFTDFGQSGLEFELRCFTDDVIWKLVIASDLRTAIANRFAAEGIQVPLPQLVVHRPEA